MSVIPFDGADEIFLKTSFWYGVLRTGKTRLAATFPRVAWFGSVREGGYRTIQNMNPQDFYEPNVPPKLFGIKTPDEFMAHLRRDVEPLVVKGAIKTIALELSIYSDETIRARANEQTWDKYADLEKHIIFVDELLKGWPIRVCYNALAATEDDKKKPSGVLMAGRAVPRKLPSLIDSVAYMRGESLEEGSGRRFVAHFEPYGAFPAGHRYGERFPLRLRNPTFRAMEAIYKGAMRADEEGNIVAGEPITVALPSLAPLK